MTGRIDKRGLSGIQVAGGNHGRDVLHMDTQPVNVLGRSGYSLVHEVRERTFFERETNCPEATEEPG